jgi:DnaK suppressor protein
MMAGLNDQQRGELLEDLKTLEASLVDLLDLTLSKTKPVSLRENIGRLSRMDEMHNQSILVANRTVTSNRLKAVRMALAQAGEGNYGCCEECAKTIAFNRLKAYPDATMCITCKGATE